MSEPTVFSPVATIDADGTNRRALPSQSVLGGAKAGALAPDVAILSNGRYHVMITASGAGSSSWQDLDVTRWHEDATRDCWGQFIYVRDRGDGTHWSIGHQPLCQAADQYEVDFRADLAEFRRRDADLETRMAICVSADQDVEVRLVTLGSMGFTPTAGVPMGTRSGDLDPGLVEYLARTEKMTATQFNKMANFRSGLLGVSEISADMRELLDREAQDVRAAEAVALFCYQIKKWIGSFAAALGGLDTLVFAGGVGENAATIRARICDGLEFLGVEIDENCNARNKGVISAVASRVAVRVIHTDEQLMIARNVCSVLGLS